LDLVVPSPQPSIQLNSSAPQNSNNYQANYAKQHKIFITNKIRRRQNRNTKHNKTNNGKKAIRRTSLELGIPRETVRRILKAEKFHQYKLHILHNLTPRMSGELTFWG
jgi:hypothetical protein